MFQKSNEVVESELRLAENMPAMLTHKKEWRFGAMPKVKNPNLRRWHVVLLREDVHSCFPEFMISHFIKEQLDDEEGKIS